MNDKMNDFGIESFAAACKKAMREADDPQAAAAALLRETLRTSDHQTIIAVLDAAIPPGASVGEMIVHSSPELTMLYARVPSRFQSGIHNHTVFACIGQLDGQERNTFYEADGDGLRVTREATVNAGDVIELPADVVHSIENPNEETASALHLYGGDFGALMDERTLWSSEDHAEKPFSFPGLVAESVARMKKSENQAGLDALVEAIPAAKKLVG